MKRKVFTPLAAVIYLITLPLLAQQGFEDDVPPPGWIQFTGTNGAGSNNEWFQSTAALNGNYSAAILFEDTGGVVSEDWLVSPRFQPPFLNTKYLVFKQKQSYPDDYGNTYSIRISELGGVPDPSEYVIVEQWNETDFTTEWTTKIIDVTSFNNQVYIAFVMAQNNGDNWFIDDVELVVDPVLPSCVSNPIPSNTSTNVEVFEGGVTLNWDIPVENVSEYDVYFGTTQGSLPLIGKAFTNGYSIASVDRNQTYYWRIVPRNPVGSPVNCAEWSFTTAPALVGGICVGSETIDTFPFNDVNNTGFWSNVYDTNSCEPGYLGGYEAIYEYTPVSGTSVDISLTNIGSNWASIQVLDDCPSGSPTCIASDQNEAETDDLSILDLALMGGTTYFVIVSTFDTPSTQSTAYTLGITENTCLNSSVNFTIVTDCDNSGGFYIHADITSLGSATSVEVADNQGGSQSVNTSGVLQLGPYVNATDVVVTVTNEQDNSCVQTSESLTQLSCPPDNNDCINAIEIIPSTTGAENWIVGTTVGTTNSSQVNYTDLSCVSEAVFGEGNDVWFKSRVPEAGELNITTRAVAGSPLTTTFISVYSGECGSLTEVGCDIDGQFNFPFSEVILEVGDVIVDDVLFIRVSREAGIGADGTFEIATHAENAALRLDNFHINDLQMYPNPVSHELFISASEILLKIQIFDVLGKEILSKEVDRSNQTVDVSSLQNGVYIVKIWADKSLESLRLVKSE